MKLAPLFRSVVSPGLFAAATLSAVAQLPSTPPVKLGLWETSATTQMQGLPMNLPGQGRATHVQVCITAESWQRNLYNTRSQKDCTRTNESYTPGHYSTDIVCTAERVSGHVDVQLQSDTASHTEAHMKMAAGSNNIEMLTTADSHFVSSDCGSVDPDHPKLIK